MANNLAITEAREKLSKDLESFKFFDVCLTTLKKKINVIKLAMKKALLGWVILRGQAK
jgi:hypothetical protein